MSAVRLSLILAVTLASAAPAADYFPLTPGNQWSYTMSTGMQMTVAVTGVAPVRGVRCAIVETTMGWQSSREYMALEANGLKTYKSEGQGQQFVHDPPVTRIKLPFQEGQTWTSTMSQMGMSLTTTYQAVGTQQVQTPAGTYDCIVIRSTAALPGQPPMISNSYYADGVGLVYQSVQSGVQQMVAMLAASQVKPAAKPRQAPLPPQTGPVQPTPPIGRAETPKERRCPQCNSVVPAGAKFCPACGAKLAPVAALPTDTAKNPAEPPAPQVALEKYQSPDGTVRLYKPHDWEVQQETFGPGSMAISVMEPEENAAVIFMTFPIDQNIPDSVKLMARCMTALREEYPDIKATSVSSSPEKDRTIAEVTLTAEGEQGKGHAYFFYTPRVGTVYFLLARTDMWEELRPMMTNVAANLAYAPEGITTVVQQAQAQAGAAPAAPGAAVSPAALIKQASQRTGKQVPLQQVALPDRSASLQIPQGWDLEGQKLDFVTVNNRQTRTHGMGCTRHPIMANNMSLPGVINAPYQPPAQALKLVLEAGPGTRDVQVLSLCSVEEAVPELAQSIQYMRAQGIQVEARLIYAQFRNVPTGLTQRGLFSVQCTSSPMNPAWQVTLQGCWAPANEFEQWLPLFMRLEKTIQVNQQWFGREMQGRAATQRKLNAGLMNSIAEADQAFDDYLGSVQNADRSRDYTSHMWSQTTLGQGTWVAENEGAKVYQTDSWGIEGPEGRIDHQAYNNTYFTGENPWGGEDLNLVDTRDEYEQYIAGPQP